MQALRQFAAVLLCASGMVYSARADAQTAAPIELKWTALDGCPSEATVLARVHKIAGTTRATANTLRADASVTQPSDGLFRLRLEIHYGNLAAVRNIEGKSCKDLAGAAAVALALLLSSEEPLSERDLAGGPLTTTQPGSSTTAAAAGAGTSGGATASNTQSDNQDASQNKPSAASQNKPTAQTTEPTGSTSSSSVVSGPPRRWRVLLVAPLGSLGVGPTSPVSAGLGGGVGFSFDRWRFLAEGRLWAAQHETSSSGYDYDVKLKRLTATARGCRAFGGTRFELAPCALISVQHLTAIGGGRSIVSSTDTATWAAVGVGARSRFLVTPWLGLVAALDGEVEFSRPEVSVSLPPVDAHDPAPKPIPVSVAHLAPVAATLTLGVEWIF
ncbi:MAG TPA: hypothetical protein VER96_24690 [Polyangiaceae bacterium]|nr:hypothetical protein [Polyangiaceae bacterium]